MARRIAALLALLSLGAGSSALADEPPISSWTLRAVARLPWGAGPGEAGRALPSEANPECPMSLEADADGRLFVLDQLNRRVQVVEKGAAVRAVPLPAATIQDLALLPGGKLALLDRLVSGTALVVDADGKSQGMLRLQGSGVPLAAGVTALFFSDGLWAEYDNAQLVRFADAGLAPLEQRATLPGRFASADAASFGARLSGRREVTVRRDLPDGRPSWSRTVAFSRDVLRILALEPDAQGRVFLVVDAVERLPGDRLVSKNAEVVALDAEGRELRRFQLPPFAGPEEQLRPVRLGADGALYQLRCEADAAVIRRLGP